MSTPLADSLSASIDRHAGGQHTNARESHDLASLARRLLVSPAVAQKFISDGLIVSEPVHRGDDRFQSFLSDELNAVRHAVLSTVVAEVIDQSESEGEVSIAANHAMNEHVKNFGAPVKLTELARDSSGRYYEENESLLGKAAKVAGAGATAVGVGAYVRGRAPGRSVLDSLKVGHAANARTAGKVGAFLRPGVAKATAAGADIFAAGSAAAKRGAAVLAERMRMRRGY